MDIEMRIEVEPSLGAIDQSSPHTAGRGCMPAGRGCHNLEDLLVATWLRKARTLFGVRVNQSHNSGGLGYVMDACTCCDPGLKTSDLRKRKRKFRYLAVIRPC